MCCASLLETVRENSARLRCWLPATKDPPRTLDARKLLKVAGEPVSRILSMRRSRERTAHRAIIPLGSGSHRSSSSLPEGCSSQRLPAVRQKPPPRKHVRFRRRAQRAGPALPSYLALHHAGFSVPPVSPPKRWALTPPFHPCLTSRALRRRLAGFPA